MEFFSPEVKTKVQAESLLRSHIEAPPHFVSVYHESRPEYLESISEHGLRAGNGTEGYERNDFIRDANILFDEECPQKFKEKGISRWNIFGYPDLDFGNDMWHQKGNPVLEMKIDPQNAYVGDMYLIQELQFTIGFFPSKEWPNKIREEAATYWGNMITLEDFKKYYRRPEYTKEGRIQDAEDYRDYTPPNANAFYVLKGAPEHFTDKIRVPEILIPDTIPEDHMRLVASKFADDDYRREVGYR